MQARLITSATFKEKKKYRQSSRCCRCARGRVEGVTATQVQEARVPDDLVALTAGDDRAQVVVDALARDALQPLERAGVAFEERLDRHLERKERGLRTRVRKRGNQRVDTPLPPRDPWWLVTWLPDDRRMRITPAGR